MDAVDACAQCSEYFREFLWIIWLISLATADDKTIRRESKNDFGSFQHDMAARFSTLRPGVALGRSVLQTCRRLQSTETSAASTAPAVPPPPRRGGIRGGYVPGNIVFFSSSSSHSLLTCSASIVGFLFGFSLASAFASYHLLEEYRLASAVLQSSVHVGIFLFQR